MTIFERLSDFVRIVRGGPRRATEHEQREAIVKAAVDSVVRQVASTEPSIFKYFHYGAIEIDPRFLVVWYVFKRDAELKTAQASGLTKSLDELTREALDVRGYPKFAAPFMAVSFTSDEDIQKKTGGNYYLYFK